MRSLPLLFAVLTSLATATQTLQPTLADDGGAEIVDTQQGTPPTAEEAAQAITAPEGFQISLFAGEPDVRQPIAITTDERGRLWVAENYTYAEAAVGFDTSLKDRILILEDADHDGRFDKRTVFWDSGQRITSVEVGFGGVWVLAAPQLLFIPDRDHDDIPDGPPEVVLDGWNTDAVRHNIVNGLRWGTDGWLYGRHGILANSFIGKPGATPSQRVELNCSIWRYHPTKQIFEVVAHGGTNSWGFDYDRHGQMFFINTVIGHLWHLVPGAHYRRMYGADFNPHLYGLIEQTADHFHWDTGEKWSDIRAGVSDTTSAAGGGHAHSGLMIYQGDNWPAEYHDRMYTINFHGRRINVDDLEREQAGYVGHHGKDFVFANNEWFRGLDLISGPDGGVFIVDWSDIGECHDNDGIHRTSGRIYKLTWGQPKPPAPADLSELTPRQLVRLQRHLNSWHVRQARRLLQEQAAAGSDLSDARTALLDIFTNETDDVLQLRALWCLYAIDGVDEEWLRQQLAHPSEHVRLWAVRLLTDAGNVSPQTAAALATCAATETSGLVRLYLASALQRLTFDQRWPIAAELVLHPEDAADKAVPLMIWYGIEPAVPANPQAALTLAEQTQIPLIRRHIVRRLTADLETHPEPVDAAVRLFRSNSEPAFQLDLLLGMNDALRGWRQAPMPGSWADISKTLLDSTSPDVRQQAQHLGIVFGDGLAMDAVRQIAADGLADTSSRRAALRALVADRAPETLPLLKQLLGDMSVSNDVIRGFAAFDDPDVPRLVLGIYPRLDPEGQTAAVDTLTSRGTYAAALLAAIESGQVASSDVSAYHARQMRSLQDPAIEKELERLWGALRETSSEKQAQLADLHALLAGKGDHKSDLVVGRRLFEKTCANCHVLFGSGARIGPDLTGSNRHNLNYLLENIIDPSASVNNDFKVSTILFADGRVLTGVVVESNDRTLTVQTQKEQLVVNRADVEEIAPQDVSLMPDGLLKPLSEAEIRDLLAYLASPAQVPLPDETSHSH